MIKKSHKNAPESFYNDLILLTKFMKEIPKLIFLMAFFWIASDVIAQKNDTLYFLNGDRISGEIKQYRYGFLTYKTYGVSTVKVKYDKISTFYSNKNFDILLQNGNRRFGSFITSDLEQYVNIIVTNDTILTPFIEIVEITPIKNKFWRRIDGSIDIGFSYTKANTLSKLTFNGEMKYTVRNYFSSIKVSSNNSIQSDIDSSRTKKNDLAINIYRRIKNNWFGIGMGSTEQNTELGLEMRLQAGGGLANELVHTNMNNLVASAGIVVNKEWYETSTGTRSNIDSYLSLNYRLFRFNYPEMDITSSVIAFPSLTVAKRWRLNYDIKLKIEVISDMYISISFYTNYDSSPLSENSDNVDYSITTSFGYSF